MRLLAHLLQPRDAKGAVIVHNVAAALVERPGAEMLEEVAFDLVVALQYVLRREPAADLLFQRGAERVEGQEAGLVHYGAVGHHVEARELGHGVPRLLFCPAQHDVFHEVSKQNVLVFLALLVILWISAPRGHVNEVGQHVVAVDEAAAALHRERRAREGRQYHGADLARRVHGRQVLFIGALEQVGQL